MSPPGRAARLGTPPASNPYSHSQGGLFMQDAVSMRSNEWSRVRPPLWTGSGRACPDHRLAGAPVPTAPERGSVWAVIGKYLLVPPAAVLVAGVWGTMVSLYTLPFRLGRAGALLTGLLMSWWDALRMAWFYWAGLVRFLVVLVGWIWGLLKLGVQLVWGTVKGAVTSPFAMLDATSPRQS